ncbi:MAG: lytic transglycosylase domain-containing protein [archaeon]|nr:lytic transglycosylase domain-containing protein [archaeon]
MAKPIKKILISRRQALGVIGAGFFSSFVGGLFHGKNSRPKSVLEKKPVMQPESVSQPTSIPQQESVSQERMTRRELFAPKPVPKPIHKFKVYREGMAGKEFTDAYGLKHTIHPFDLSNKRLVNSKGFRDLVHDIKHLVIEQCSKYNRVCEINPKGIKLIDPYEVLAIIEHESHYNPNAYRTAANDRGLGQIVPVQEERLKTLPKMPVVITDFYDPKQNIEGIVRTLAWITRNPANTQKPTTWRRFASYNAGRGGAKDQIVLRSRRYANTVTAIWERMRNNNELTA